MASQKICAAPNCGKRTWGGPYCSMHTARLRRGASLEPRQPKRSLADLLDGRTQFFGWTVLGEGDPHQRRPLPNGKPHPSGRQRTARCRCICGVERDIAVHTLKQGQSRHCGCLVPAITIARNTTHGLSKTPEYSIWSKMKGRCSDKGDPDYGGRGIEVCARWQTFESFLADMGQRPSPKHSIERDDVNGDYEPANCRWATPREQAQNKRGTVWVHLDGERLALREACRRLGLSANRYKVVHQRMFRRGMAFERAVQFDEPTA